MGMENKPLPQGIQGIQSMQKEENKRYRIAVCDDDEKEASRLRDRILSLMKEFGHETPLVDQYLTGESLTERNEENGRKYDLIFLDIFLPGTNGVEVAKMLRAAGEECQIVFLSFSTEFAVEAFQLRALHYLVKPVGDDDLREVFRRFEKIREESVIRIEVHGSTVALRESSIHFLRSNHNNVEIYTSSGVMRCRGTLTEYSARMGDHFLLLTRGFLCNMAFISKMGGGECSLEDGQRVLLSRQNQKAIQARYMNYLFNRGTQ